MNPEGKTLIKNGVLFSIAPFLPKMVSILLLPIMTKYLTATDYGIAGTISAYSESIGAFTTLGLTVVLMNSFYKYPESFKETWKKIYGFLNCWMIIYAILQAIILYLCIPEEAADNKWWIIGLTNFSTVLFGPTANIGSMYYTYNKQSFPVVWRSVLASMITLIGTFVMVVCLKGGYMGWYVGGFIGTFFSNMTYWPVVNLKLGIRPSYKFSREEIKHYLSISMPTIPHYYSTYLLQGSGRMVLDQYHCDRDKIGQLSIAQQIGGLFEVAVTGMNRAVSPFFMTYIKKEEWPRYKKLAIVFISVVFSLTFMISIWSKEIFDILLSNEELASSYPYAILYIMAFCYRPMYVIASNFNFYFEKTKQLLWTTLLSGVIAFIFYIGFIPIWGVWAFLIGRYIACLYYGYSLYYYSCYKQHSQIRIRPLLVLFAQLFITAMAFLLVDYLIIKIVITILLLLSLCLVYKRYRCIIMK